VIKPIRWPRLARLVPWVCLGGLLASCSKPDTLEGRIEAVAEHANEEGELNGNVLITRGNTILYEHSFGPADAADDVDNTPDTRFMITSLSEPFTAVLVLQLVAAGKLATDTPLAAVFPVLVDKPAGSITVHQLLTHTSGIDELISHFPGRRITPADLTLAMVNRDGGFNYSNTGYVCLSLVIEAVSGQSYEALLIDRIFKPAGMNDSGVLRSGRKIRHFARGHHGVVGLEAVDLDFAPEAVDGAGSIYSTARDLWRFDRALKANALLSARMQELMFTQHVPGLHGYGWFLSELGGHYYPWHAGDMAGYSASFARQLERDAAIIVLGNTAATDARGLQQQFLQLLNAQP